MEMFDYLFEKFTLPLSNPVLVFSIFLFVILSAPIFLKRIKIPHLIGLIIAGAIIGPNGLNLLLRDSSVVLFGTVGLLYIMFLAGLEIDLADFKKNSSKSLVFGMYTFLIPMGLGIMLGYLVLGFTLPTSVLLASMFASHTLITYPLINKLGITKNKAVNVAVGGTMITDTLALLILAVIAGMAHGELTSGFWVRLSVSMVIFGSIVMFLFPIIGRWFFKHIEDSVSQYIFVLGMVFLSAFLAEAAGVEAIIGAFLAGLSLNRLIPHTSPLMNRINFVGNALFIPFFLIGVGMLIDFRAFLTDMDTIIVGVCMTVVATLAKFLAAWATQKTFKLSVDQRHIIFGLSNSQAAATLAAVLVGYNIILGQTPTGEPIRLLNESVLNGTIMMILVTCTIASFITQKGAQNIAIAEKSETDGETGFSDEHILIPINNIENADELVNLSITVKSKQNKNGLYVLNVVNNNTNDPLLEKNAKKILEKATIIASATDNAIHPLLRYDINIVNGINSVVREFKITDVILGLHKKNVLTDSFLGNLTDGILTKCDATVFVYKPAQPLSTVKRAIVVIPGKAEKELGFAFWLIKIWNIGRNTGAKLVFYGQESTLEVIKGIHLKHPVEAEFQTFDSYDDFLIISRDVKPDDKIVVVMARHDMTSYQPAMEKIPAYLNNYFQPYNFILVYPAQFKMSSDTNFDIDNPYEYDGNISFGGMGKLLSKIFGK